MPNSFNRFQSFVDQNIKIIRNASWILGGVAIVIIIRRTYAIHHFTEIQFIPKSYFRNHAILTGKVTRIDNDGCLHVMHLPLLWRSRIKHLTTPAHCLKVNLTGVELLTAGNDYIKSQLNNSKIKFQLLGTKASDHIEAIVYEDKAWFRRTKSVNEEVISMGLAKVMHVPALSHTKIYNRFIERLVAAEVFASKRKRGIWKEDIDDGVLKKFWSKIKCVSRHAKR
ncbi:uncharacterized protein LOC124443733 isoform X2 [Xenia sp. Carnegie-2017]|uniref:uncharacterized protein LOC124443733 isoform X2 n=1 Tax=Xenia sp. Carnegie-2017 TaxID=2897299 RepID=UPI001F03FFFA|nr:uncharacterized protein LOC124443733 isoform X2 [Xenia sp. Carnegie-2017]